MLDEDEDSESRQERKVVDSIEEEEAGRGQCREHLPPSRRPRPEPARPRWPEGHCRFEAR